MKKILLVLAFIFCFIITFDLFLKEPPVWPDEASLAYLSSVSTGNLITDYKIYPSLYIALLSGWFKINNISIETQRILSVLAGFIFIIIFYFFVNKISINLSKNNFLIIVPIILLIIDFTFLQATRIGRPEIFTLLFGMISIYLLYIFIANGYYKYSLLGFSIIFAILAFVFHINGIIYLLTFFVVFALTFKKLYKNNKQIIIFPAIFIIIFLTFFSFIINLSFSNILTRFEIAGIQDTWILTVLTSKPLEMKLMYLLFISITLLFFCYTFFKRELRLFVITFPLLLSWIILILNKDFWYAVYLIPLAYLAIFILLENYVTHRAKFYGLIFVCLLIFLSNLKLHLDILFIEGGNRYSYLQFISEIQKTIPDGKSVFTSAIPDPYYAFTNRKNNKIVRFPQSFVDKANYINELDEIDFIIYNGPYGHRFYGDLLEKYLEINTLKSYQIGTTDQYNATIIELKPTNQRTNPY